jgi:hypothetical protein
VTAAGPPRRLPAPPALEQLARADAALQADLTGFTRLNSAAVADLAEVCALLARGFVSRDEARAQVAAVPWPPRPPASRGVEMFEGRAEVLTFEEAAAMDAAMASREGK